MCWSDGREHIMGGDSGWLVYGLVWMLFSVYIFVYVLVVFIFSN